MVFQIGKPSRNCTQCPFRERALNKHMIPKIILNVLQTLVKNDQLELTPDADINELRDELVRELASAQTGSQFGSWLAKQLLESNWVEELYVTDQELYRLLDEIEA